jgi:hypothetical protein
MGHTELMPKIIAMMPVRNEDWVLGLSARVALSWCDNLLILNHCSTDRTPEILSDLVAEYGDRITVLCESDPKWDEMPQRQRLLEEATRQEATHLAIVDADELLSANLVDSIRDMISIGTPGSILNLPGYNLRGSLWRYHANGVWGNRQFSFSFCNNPHLHWAGDMFHHREPMGFPLAMRNPIGPGNGGILHLWGASERRLRAKHALYAITERLRWPYKSADEINRNYGQSQYDRPWLGGDHRTWTYGSVASHWLEPFSKWFQYLDLDSPPWQERAVREAITEHGAQSFAGLDLYGVA